MTNNTHCFLANYLKKVLGNFVAGNFVAGKFVAGNFAVANFAVRKFCPVEFSPKVSIIFITVFNNVSYNFIRLKVKLKNSSIYSPILI